MNVEKEKLMPQAGPVDNPSATEVSLSSLEPTPETQKKSVLEKGQTRRGFLQSILALGAIAAAESLPGKAFAGSPASKETQPSPEATEKFVEQAQEKGAIESANQFLKLFVAAKSKIKDRLYLGPNFDGTYFYRLGEVGSHGMGMGKAELLIHKEKLIKLGFPTIQQSELDLVNLTSYIARKETRPKAESFVKHFPGGDEFLENTEKEPKHYGDKEKIAQWINNFREIIESNIPPDGIMLSHCTYDLEGFPGMEKILPHTEFCPGLRDIEPASIPASLNPAVVKYLREELGYQGWIIPDWYEMDSIDRFILRVKIPYFDSYQPSSHLKPQSYGYNWDTPDELYLTDAKTFYLALNAGIDCPTGLLADLGNREIWQEFVSNYPAEFKAFEAKLDQKLEANFQKLAARNPVNFNFDLTQFTFAEKSLLLLEAVDEWDKFDFVQKKNQVVFKAFADFNPHENDVWNRVGILTLVQRQKIIEKISGRSFAHPPFNRNQEETWFAELMSNKTFRSYYDTIDWGSAAIQRLFTEEKAKRLTQITAP